MMKKISKKEKKKIILGLIGNNNLKYDIFIRQFIRNMLIGTLFALLWYYGFFIWSDSFILATILTNMIGFILGRYYIYKEGAK